MTTWRVELVGSFGRRHDAFIDAETATSVGELGRALEDEGFRGWPLGLDGRSLGVDETLGQVQLEHGSTLTCGGAGLAVADPGAGRYVVVVAGPDAGRRVLLSPDTAVTVGRTGADLAIDDPFLSSHHCTFHDEGGRLTVNDATSTNGTRVEGAGESITEPVELTAGEHVHAGSSVLTVVDVTADDIAVLGSRGPERVFARQFRTALSALPRSVEAPRASDREGHRTRISWWRGLLPIVTGAGMAAITGRWIFLLIMAVSPLVITLDALSRRRRVRDDAQHDEAEYHRQLEDFRQRVRNLRRVERDRRREAATCGGVALLTGAVRHRRLWERAPLDADFMSVAVGLASLPSAVQATDPDGDDDDLQWGTPLETNLLETGSLAVVGPERRARAVARGLLLSLAATHSPTELRIWLLTRDQGAEWGFARWLPHTFNGDQGSHIATDDHSRALAMKSIKQLLDTRAELAANEQALPVHLVVIDGIDLLAPGELADLLGGGPQHGIVGLTIDRRLAPEGIGATLTVTTDRRRQHVREPAPAAHRRGDRARGGGRARRGQRPAGRRAAADAPRRGRRFRRHRAPRRPDRRCGHGQHRRGRRARALGGPLTGHHGGRRLGVRHPDGRRPRPRRAARTGRWHVGFRQDRVPQDAARVALPQQPPRRPLDRHRRLQGRGRPRRRAPDPPCRRRGHQPRHRAVPADDRDAQGRVAAAPRPPGPGRHEQRRRLPDRPDPRPHPPRPAAAARRRRRVRRAAGQRGRARAAQGARVDHPHRARPRSQPAARHAELRGQPAEPDRRQRRVAHLPAGAEAGPLQGRAQLQRGGDDPGPLRRPGLRPLPRARPHRVPDRPCRRPSPRPGGQRCAGRRPHRPVRGAVGAAAGAPSRGRAGRRRPTCTCSSARCARRRPRRAGGTARCHGRRRCRTT